MIHEPNQVWGWILFFFYACQLCPRGPDAPRQGFLTSLSVRSCNIYKSLCKFVERKNTVSRINYALRASVSELYLEIREIYCLRLQLNPWNFGVGPRYGPSLSILSKCKNYKWLFLQFCMPKGMYFLSTYAYYNCLSRSHISTKKLRLNWLRLFCVTMTQLYIQ